MIFCGTLILVMQSLGMYMQTSRKKPSVCVLSDLADICQGPTSYVLVVNALQVPTFLFYRGGKPTGRHVGSSRADLIGQILQQQNAHGVRPPVTGQGAQSQRRKIERRV